MKSNIPQCPTLRPSFKEFQHFSAFVQKVEKQYRNTYGMVKIVPPKQWISRKKNYDKIINNLVISKPQYQSLYGDPRNFYFNCQNGNHGPLKIQQFKELAAKKVKEISDYRNNEDIQQYFWNIYSSLRNQLYCANIEVTLMDSTSGEWEFQKLKSFFNQAVTQKLNGLNTSFLFVGAWRTFFNWHIEDLDLSAINLLHEGATKMWYCIHPQDRKRYETVLKDLFPEQNMKCPNFYRHKQIYLNPYKLKERYPYLRISKMYQNEGEISLAFANGYHCGFNMGFNIAEAVNYGTKDWLQRYGQFKKCKCPIQAGVCIDYQDIVNNLKKSDLYRQIKNTQAFAKIVEKAKQEIEVDQLFKNTDSNQIREEVERERSKSYNKGKEYIYVRKFNRYFPAQEELIYQIECESCGAWRKIDERTKKMYQNRSFICSKIDIRCKLKGGKKSQTKSQQSKTEAETKANRKRKMIRK